MAPACLKAGPYCNEELLLSVLLLFHRVALYWALLLCINDVP
jgi:hypothetical protein